jgi:hypothetical protein
MTTADASTTVEFTPKVFLQHVPPIANWIEWLALAQAATTLEQKLGLLHVGFDVEMQQSWRLEKDMTATERALFRLGVAEGELIPIIYRVKFYLGVADGWTQASLLRDEGLFAGDEPKYVILNPHGGYSERLQSQQRQVLARKAFDMLSARFFKPLIDVLERAERAERDEISWLYVQLLDLSLPLIQDFFRIDQKGCVRNLSKRWSDDRRPQSENQVIDFLLKLPRLLWNWKEGGISNYDSAADQQKKRELNGARRAVVDSAKLWMIEVLAELKELKVLEPWLLDFDEPCLAKLTEIALRNELSRHDHLVLETRKVATIDEACLLGSASGWLLKKHELMTAEAARLRSIKTAQLEMQEAAKRVAKLTGQQP